jgi:hypothetical protein
VRVPSELPAVVAAQHVGFELEVVARHEAEGWIRALERLRSRLLRLGSRDTRDEQRRGKKSAAARAACPFSDPVSTSCELLLQFGEAARARTPAPAARLGRVDFNQSRCNAGEPAMLAGFDRT